MISIEYCVMWNYHPRAARVADKINKETGQETKLIKGSGGVFEVKVGDELIYSKNTTGCFPDEEKLVADLKAKLSK